MINKILCIDDDQITLVLCDMVIKKAKFANEVVTASNGRDGLNWFSNYFAELKKQDIDPPILIFLDLNMPIMKGWDFLEDYLMKYRDRLLKTYVVILSSTVNPEDFSRANKYDIVIDFISKPLTVEGLNELKKNEKISHYFED